MLKPKESQIQTAIEHYLLIQEHQGKLVYQKNNSGAFKTERGSFVRFGRAGSPDFIIFLSCGVTCHLEVKTEIGTQNKNQKEYQDKITKLGHYYFLVRSVDEVEELLRGLNR